MSDILRFDIAGARKEFGDKKTYDYLRNNLQSNVNWDLFDKEFTDNIAQGLDVLEQSQLSISGKIPQSYNVHTQARNTLGEDIPTELKEVEHKNSLLETLHTLGEGALDILDVKPLVNPILKSTIGTEIPDNVLQSDERRQYLSDVRDNIKYKLANNMPLDSDEIHRLKLDEGVLDSLKDKSLTNKLNEAFLNNNTGKDPLQVYNEVIAKEYKDKQEIFNTDNYTDLSDAQKEIIDRDTGVFDKIEQYVSDATPDERLAHYKESKLEENITKKTTEALIWLENTDPHTDIFSLISKLGGGEEDSKKRVAYLNRVESIAQAAGFDGVATDEKNQVYFFKNDAQGQKNFYKPNKDFFSNFKQWLSANAGSTTGAIAGFAKGLKSGNVYKAIGYSALGAFGGGALDYAIASQVANRENNFSDMLRHATQEGALGAVVDVAGLGLKYAGSHALKALKNTDSNIIGAVTDYIPIVGFAKRWRTGNTQAGYKGLDHAYTKDELEALSAYAREFGGDLTLKSQKPNALTQNLALKFGEDHRLTKGARFLDYLFKINDQSQAQKHFLSAIRADESGDLIGFVTQIAKESPKIQNNLRHILTTTTNNLTKRLESFGLDSLSVKDIFSNFEKGTKDDYREAMEGILAKVYDDNYKVVLSKEGVNPKEARGIYNVTHNGKNATIIHKDLQNIDEAILYTSGNRSKGAKHIRIKHSKETNKQGYVTDSELASLGRDIREFLKRNEPFIDNNGARLYEWEKDGVRFRAVVNDIADMDSNPTTAMGEIITFYSDRNLKEPMRFKNPSLSHQKESYAQFRKKLESSGVLPEDSMRFLNFVEKNIYNEKGVTFEQLNNALKNINSYYKQTLDPNFKSFLKQSVEGFLREDIKSGIEQIFAQNKELYKDASALFSTALSDYATMKKALKTIDRLKVRDEAKSKAQALSNIYKYLQGQGGEVSNIQNLTKGLSPEQKANFEVALLYGMFQKTLLDLGKDKVFNSRAFFENLGNLAIEFQSKEAKDFIDIARGFDTLFKNDALIAQSLGAALPKEVGSSIATSIEGAAKFQMVKMMFEALMRLMPHIPFAKGFNEKIQGMALRYHLRKALNQSSDISEFKFNLKKAGENPSINSPTRELINKITSEVNEAQDEILEKIAREEANASNEFRDTAINLKPEHIGDDPLSPQGATQVGDGVGANAHNHSNNASDSVTAMLDNGQDRNLKSTIETTLSPDEIKAHIEKWDLSNPKKEDKLLIGKVEGKELEELNKDFDFKGNYAIAREIDAQHVAHTLNRHSDETLEAARNQIPITKDDIANYEQIIKTHDMREVNGNRIVYKKQVNGHYVVVEEVLTGKNKLEFVTMWKGKGDITTPPTPSSKGYDLDRTLSGSYDRENSTTQSLKTPTKDTQNGNTHHHTIDTANSYDNLKREEHIQDAPRANGYDNDASTPSPSNPTDQNHSMPTQEGGRELPIQGSKQGGEGGASTGYSDAIHTGDAQNHEGLAKENTSPEIPKDLQEKWIKEFDLKSIDDTFVPSFKPEVKEALEKAGVTEDIKLTKGSLVKLVRENRFKYLDRIKPTLQEPDRIVKQDDITFIFAKDFGEEKYFTSVAKDDNGEWIITSNAPKSENGLNNKIAKGGEEIYNKQAGSQINASTPYDDVANSNTKLDSIDSTTKAPTTQTLTKQQAYHKIVGEYGKIFKKLPKVLADKDIDSILRDTKTLADIRKRSFDERGFNPSLAELAAQDYFRKDKAINAFIYKAREYGLDLGFSSFTQFFKKRYGTQIKNDEQVKDMLASLDFFKSIKIDENPQRFTDIKMSEDKSGFNSYVESKINKYLGIDEMAKKLTHNPKFDKLQAMLDLYYQAKRITKNPKDIQKVEQYANTLRPFFPSLVNKNTSDFLYEIDNLAYYAHNLLQSKVYIDLDSNFLYPAREAIEYFLDIKPLKEFGTNYAEYFRDGQRGIAKLLAEAKDYETRKAQGKLTEAEIEQGAYKGQVAGAFYKEGLGDIDLVWGNENLGLQKIITKHLDDFKVWGEGEDGVIKGLDDIVENGKVISENGVDTIWLRKDGHYYVVGLSEGWKGQGSNKWIITSYEKRDMTPQQKENIDKLLSSDTRGLSPASEFNELQSPNPTTNVDSTTNSHNVSKAQAKKQEVLNKIKSKEHKEYLRLQTKLEESKELEAQAFKELEPIKERILAQTKAKEYYAQALEKLDIKAFNYEIQETLKPIFSRIKKARRGQEHYKERLFSYPLKKLQGKSLTFNEKEFPLYENALTLKQSHSIDKNPKLIKERVALRKAIESYLDIKPIKEFGTNYAEGYHDGAWSIKKLLDTREGQVAGAFYKEGLGDIDLVWGDSHFGLQHILERRTEQWGEERALRFISHLPEIIQESKIIQGRGGSIELLSPRSTIILAKKDDNHFMITAFRDSGNKNKLKELENSQTFHDESFTSKSDSERNGTDILSQNQRADSTTKPFKQQDISFENFEDFSKYAKLSGIEFESEAQEREAYKHIQSKLKSLEC